MQEQEITNIKDLSPKEIEKFVLDKQGKTICPNRSTSPSDKTDSVQHYL